MAKKPKVFSVSSIQDILNGMTGDIESFNAGKGAPGTRIRKGLMEIKKLCGEKRNEITAIKQSR